MFADAETRSESLDRSWRRLRAAGLAVALAAGLLAAGLAGSSSASASAATMFTQSAKGGVLKDGRLTLRGVSGRVTYVLNTGRRGTLSVRRLHRRLFLPGLRATGTLHVAGDRGGDEPSFRLSKPRRNAARHTVSYRAKRLDKKPLARRAARTAGAAERGFGAASLSLVPHPRLTGGDNGGLDCSTTLTNNTSHLLEASAESNWPTDTWGPGIPFQAQLTALGTGTLTWVSDGGFLRGCSASSTWVFVPDPSTGDPNPPMVSFSTTTTYHWDNTWSDTCTSSDPQDFPCQATGINGPGNASWSAYQPPSQ